MHIGQSNDPFLLIQHNLQHQDYTQQSPPNLDAHDLTFHAIILLSHAYCFLHFVSCLLLATNPLSTCYYLLLATNFLWFATCYKPIAFYLPFPVINKA